MAESVTQETVKVSSVVLVMRILRGWYSGPALGKNSVRWPTKSTPAPAPTKRTIRASKVGICFFNMWFKDA